jgi:AraC-like DNA-binding protein
VRLSFLPQFEARYAANCKVCHRKHTHSEYSIGLVDAGKTRYSNKKETFKIEGKTVVFVNPNEVHSCYPTNSSWTYRMLYINAEWFRGFVSQSFEDKNAPVKFEIPCSTDSRLYKKVSKIFDIMTSGLSEAEIEVRILILLESVIAYNGLFGNSRIASPRRKEIHDFNRIVAYIKEHCKEPITLSDLQGLTGLSKFHFLRCFKDEIGETPHALQTGFKINIARNLIKSGAPLARIALECGFSDQAHMQRFFKQYLAVTPRTYGRGSAVNH